MREMTPPSWGRSIGSCMTNVSRYLTGWMSHFRLCTPEAAQLLGNIDPRRCGESGVLARVKGSFASHLAHAFSGHGQAVSVVDQTIEDGIGQGGVSDDFVPLIDGNLASDEG